MHATQPQDLDHAAIDNAIQAFTDASASIAETAGLIQATLGPTLSADQLIALIPEIRNQDLRHDIVVALLQAMPLTALEARILIRRKRELHKWDLRQQRARLVQLTASHDEEPESERGIPDALGPIYDLVHQLPAVQRDVLVMRYISGLSGPETARRLGVGRATVTRHTAAALRAVRALANCSEPLSASPTPYVVGEVSSTAPAALASIEVPAVQSDVTAMPVAHSEETPDGY